MIKPENITILVRFHSLRGYDSHLYIMQQIGEIAKNHAYKNKKGKEQPLKINAILNNVGKYMAFMSGNHLNFIDSFQFMNSSLNNLVGSVTKRGKCESHQSIFKKLEIVTAFLFDQIPKIPMVEIWIFSQKFDFEK